MFLQFRGEPKFWLCNFYEWIEFKFSYIQCTGAKELYFSAIICWIQKSLFQIKSLPLQRELNYVMFDLKIVLDKINI